MSGQKPYFTFITQFWTLDKRDSHNPRTKPKLSFFGQRKPDKLGPRRQRFEEETALKEEEENQSLHTVEAMLKEI